MPTAIWITWENQIRNQSLSARLGVELYVISSKRTRLVRYVVCTFQSILLILRRRPSVVFAQNPSIILTLLMILLKYPFRYIFITDAHYAGIIAPNKNWLFQKTLDLCNRCADFVIVTNEIHSKYVEALGGRAIVCEDPLPDIEKYANLNSEQPKKVFFICSFDIDEPYTAVFEAAEILKKEGYIFWVSGNFNKVNIIPSKWPYVRFLGYIHESEFYTHIAESQIVIDLTTQDNCLVCGAYEAMALEKPLVTSKTLALQRYFTAGTIFVDHNPESIAKGIRSAYEQKSQLKHQINQWKKQAIFDNEQKLESLRALLNLVTLEV